jgi:hypothetical protein
VYGITSLLGNIRSRGFKGTRRFYVYEKGRFDVILLVLQMLRRSYTPETSLREDAYSRTKVFALGDTVRSQYDASLILRYLSDGSSNEVLRGGIHSANNDKVLRY